MSYLPEHKQPYPPSGIPAWAYGNETDLHIGGRQVPIPGAGQGGHGPVEATTVVVSVGDRGVDEGGGEGPGVLTTAAGLAAKDVPYAGHEVGAEGDQDDELEQTQQHCPGRQ